MNRQAEYRQQARECVEKAKGSTNPDERLTLLEMAQAWQHMAEHSTEIKNLVDEARDKGVLPPKSEMN